MLESVIMYIVAHKTQVGYSFYLFREYCIVISVVRMFTFRLSMLLTAPTEGWPG